MPQNSGYSVELVEHALEVFHSTDHTEQRRNAEIFLEEFEETEYAWDICHSMLLQNKSLKCRHFAARCFKAKIMHGIHKIPATERLSIRDMLLHHLESTSQGDRPVMVALCVALVDLALQMPTWSDSVNDVISRYGDKPNFLPALLEILTLYPEEMTNEKLRLSGSRRAQIKDDLSRSGVKVMSLLNTCIQTADEKDSEYIARVINCLGSWCSISALRIQETMNTPLVRKLFMFLNDTNTPMAIHDACMNCVVSALPDIVYEASAAKQKADDLVDSILKYEELFQLSLQAEDMDRCKNYTRIFVTLGESILDCEKGTLNIFSYPKLLDVLLNCSAHPDFEVTEMMLELWQSLSVNVAGSSEDDLRTFKNCFTRLLCSLWKSCRYNPEEEKSLLNAQETSAPLSFYDSGSVSLYRGETLVRFRALFHMAEDWLTSGDDEFEAYRSHVWECVNDMTDAIGYCSSWENMQATTKPCFEHTVLTLFGHLGYWFGKHPEYTDQVLMHIEKGLRTKELANPASRALQELSQYCRSHLTKYFHQLMDLFARLDGQGLREEDMDAVSSAMVNVLNEMPEQVQLQCLNELCNLVREPLEKIARDHRNNESKGTDRERQRSPIIWLNHLACIFKNLTTVRFKTENNPVAEIINGLWPTLGDIALIFVGNDDVMEKVVRCLRYMVRFLGKQSGASLLPVFAKFTDLFATAQHSCILYLASVLVDEFGEMTETREGFSSMLDALCTPVFALLTSESAVRQHPDLIDDFFRFCRRICEKCVETFVFHRRLEEILKLSLLCCRSTNYQANHSVYCVWSAFLTHSYTKPDTHSHVSEIIQKYVPELICKAFQCVYFDSSVYMVTDLAQLFDDLHKFDPNGVKLSEWLDKGFESLPFNSHPENGQSTETQLADVRKALLSYSTLDSKIAALSTFFSIYK